MTQAGAAWVPETATARRAKKAVEETMLAKAEKFEMWERYETYDDLLSKGTTSIYLFLAGGSKSMRNAVRVAAKISTCRVSVRISRVSSVLRGIECRAGGWSIVSEAINKQQQSSGRYREMSRRKAQSDRRRRLKAPSRLRKWSGRSVQYAVCHWTLCQALAYQSHHHSAVLCVLSCEPTLSRLSRTHPKLRALSDSTGQSHRPILQGGARSNSNPR